MPRLIPSPALLPPEEESAAVLARETAKAIRKTASQLKEHDRRIFLTELIEELKRIA